jgi:hypothetical protein
MTIVIVPNTRKARGHSTQHKGFITDTQHKRHIITILCHYVECHYAECHFLFIVMLNVVVPQGTAVKLFFTAVTNSEA